MWFIWHFIYLVNVLDIMLSITNTSIFSFFVTKSKSLYLHWYFVFILFEFVKSCICQIRIFIILQVNFLDFLFNPMNVIFTYTYLPIVCSVHNTTRSSIGTAKNVQLSYWGYVRTNNSISICLILCNKFINLCANASGCNGKVSNVNASQKFSVATSTKVERLR